MKKSLLTLIVTALMIQYPFFVKASVDIPRKIHFNALSKIADNTLKIKISTLNKEKKNTLEWFVSSGDRAILFTKLAGLEHAIKTYSPLKIKDVSDDYQGIQITITDTNGRNLVPITLYKGALRDERGNLFAIDPLRHFEYWLWSTGNSLNLNSVYKMLPIIDFKQCASLGHQIIETKPRQCLVHNGDIFLDVMEEPTQESLSITTFDACLVEGQAIIQTFPRRCIAAGGHVFTEPPRLKTTQHSD